MQTALANGIWWKMQLALKIDDEQQIVGTTCFGWLSREFDARIAEARARRERTPAPPSPKGFCTLPWRFHSLKPISYVEPLRVSVREYSGRPHQYGGYTDGRFHSRFYAESDDDREERKVAPLTYRQIVQNGKPVPLTQQVRIAPIPSAIPGWVKRRSPIARKSRISS